MDRTEFFRRLIEETRVAFKLPALRSEQVDAAVKDILAGSDAGRIWETAEKLGPETYLTHHRTTAAAVIGSGTSGTSWIEKIERSVKGASHSLRNPFVLGATILGVSVAFKAISRLLDDHHHARTAAIEKDVIRGLEAAALTGNVPFLTLASVGDKLIDSASGASDRRPRRPHTARPTGSHTERIASEHELSADRDPQPKR